MLPSVGATGKWRQRRGGPLGDMVAPSRELKHHDDHPCCAGPGGVDGYARSGQPTEAEPGSYYIVKGQCDLSALIFSFFYPADRGSDIPTPKPADLSRARVSSLLGEQSAAEGRDRRYRPTRVQMHRAAGSVLRACACKKLQAVPKRASSSGIERPRWVTADPDFPGSAV